MKENEEKEDQQVLREARQTAEDLHIQLDAIRTGLEKNELPEQECVSETLALLIRGMQLDQNNKIQAAFDKVSLFMNKGGAFVFDVNTVYKHKNILADNSYIYDYDDVFCAWQNTLRSDACVDITLDFFALGQDGLWERYTEEFTEQAYPLEDLEKMLAKSGFTVLSVYDDMTFDPVKPDSDRAVFLARKD